MAELHIITGEYPPQTGGVSDYTRIIATGLAEAGESVHVWCPPAAGETPEVPGVGVHRELGDLSPAALARCGRLLDRFPAPRRLLVQWVPHSYGYRSLNVGFCRWLVGRARAGDRVEIMVHEPSLGFRRGAVRHNVAAMIHRLMTVLLLRAARQVWVAAPEWEARWRPYALGRRVPFAWLPIPGNVPVVDDPTGIGEVRAAYARDGRFLVGHFGTYPPGVAELLERWAMALLRREAAADLLLLGRGGLEFRERLLRSGVAPGRVHATGGMGADRLSLHLSACDVLIQPYPAGVNARRGSILGGLEHAVPIVTTVGPATEELWSASGAVCLVPETQPELAAEQVIRLLHDSNSRADLSRRAADLYRGTFDPRVSVSMLCRAVEPICA